MHYANLAAWGLVPIVEDLKYPPGKRLLFDLPLNMTHGSTLLFQPTSWPGK